MFEGQDVIVRTYSAGVHFGTLESREGAEVVLHNARRVWRWKGAFTLHAVAGKGVREGSMLSIPVPQILVRGVIEIIPCSSAATENLRGIIAHE